MFRLRYYKIALGLHAHGYHHLGQWLDNNLKNICDDLHLYPEFVRGEDTDHPQINRAVVDVTYHDPVLGTWTLRIMQLPQEVQAWTLAAYLALSGREQQREALPAPGEFEKGLIAGLSTVIPSTKTQEAGQEVVLTRSDRG